MRFHRRASVDLDPGRLVARIALVLALAVSIAAGGAPTASASYPGRAGVIAFPYQSHRFESDQTPLDGYQLDAVRPPGRHVRGVLECSLAGGYSYAQVICPLAAPAFSPDGRQMAFLGDEVSSGSDASPACPTLGACPSTLTIANVDGRAARTLAPLTADDEQPAFLPGGQTLVFAGRPQQGAPFDLYTITSSGTGLTRLTSSGASQPAPCANGSIAFVHRGDIYLLSADHRTQRRLTLRGGNSPDCSPDGRWIAFVRHRDLYLINSAGTRVRRLTTHHVLDRPPFGEQDERPAFAPTGQRIAIITFNCRSHRNCCSKNYDGSNPNCVEPFYQLDVVDLRGRVRSKLPVSSCYANREGSTSCDALGGVAWQPLSTR